MSELKDIEVLKQTYQEVKKKMEYNRKLSLILSWLSAILAILSIVNVWVNNGRS
jgi:hypothetical protein